MFCYRPWFFPRFFRAAAQLSALSILILACESWSGSSPEGSRADSEVDSVAGMSAEMSQRVLAQVGSETIRLADYALMLSRMDRFERMRYQSEDRRKALLEEMINLRLLAQEANRRGLHKLPETQALIWQAQRDEVFAELRRGLPERSKLSETEVAAFFQSHREEFSLPESRRLAELVLADRQLAKQLIVEAKDCDSECWEALVGRHSTTPRKIADSPANNARPGFVVAGDIGFVVRGEDSLGTGSSNLDLRVAGQVRAAGFAIDRDGGVFPELVAVGEKFHIVRRVALQPARVRELAEVDALVRNRLVEEKFSIARTELLVRLKREFPVQIDEVALAKIADPGAAGPASMTLAPSEKP